MSSQFVFVHGWGTAPDFWDGLIDHLPSAKAHRVDLGFINGQQTLLNEASKSAIYVTHSVGTMWALKNHHTDMKALIAINGFGCFQNFTDARTLRAMKLRLQKEPRAQMNDFWEMCALSGSEQLNVERLQEGLEWLTSWDTTPVLKGLKCPVLALTGQNDPILPVDLMKTEWGKFDMQISERGGHALPVKEPQWCAKRIEEFLDDL